MVEQKCGPSTTRVDRHGVRNGVSPDAADDTGVAPHRPNVYVTDVPRETQSSIIDHRPATIDPWPSTRDPLTTRKGPNVCATNRRSARFNVARKMERRSRFYVCTQEVAPRSQEKIASLARTERALHVRKRPSDGMRCRPIDTDRTSSYLGQSVSNTLETVVVRTPRMTWKTCHTARTSA